MTNREQQRQRNREKYPDIAAVIDKARRVFGDDQVIVESLKERDRELEKRSGQ